MPHIDQLRSTRLVALAERRKRESPEGKIVHIFRTGINECKKCQALEGTKISSDIWADEEKMKAKGFWKQKNGEYLPHPNCKCHWEKKEIPKRKKEDEQRDALITAFKKHTGSNKLAKQLADEVINVLKENHHARYQAQTLKNVFLVFNGEYLMSSDGKLLLPAVAGKPVKTEEKTTKATIYGYVGKEKTKHFDYSKLRQCKINEGPLPEGTYTIQCEETGSLLKGSIKKHGLKRGAWGDYHWDLTPTKDTDLLGRDGGFTIHGGNDPESAGCIDITSNDWKLKNYLQTLPQKEIYVVSKYHEGNVSVTVKEPQSYPIQEICY